MQVKELYDLVTKASQGIDDIERGAVGSNGYGFVFKDYSCNLPYVFLEGSSKICNFNYISRKTKEYKEETDLLILGSLMTLFPSLKIGGFEHLFDVWMFVKTEDNKTFPARLYYRQSGLAIGGWHIKIDKSTPTYYMSEEKWKKKFPNEFLKIISCSPFNLSKNEIDMFLEALKLALKKIPISDFWCVFNYELNNKLMGIEKGKPFINKIGQFKKDYEYEKKIGKYLNKKYYDSTGSTFTVKELPENNIYVIDFECGHPTSNWFGNAKDIYYIIKEMRVHVVDLLIPSLIMKKIRDVMKLTEYTSDSSFVTFLLKKSLASKSFSQEIFFHNFN